MFIHYNANPLYKDTDDCTVRAISLFTGKTYDETNDDRNTCGG